VPTIRLASMGSRVPSLIRCLNPSEQAAQKLHACTGPYSAVGARDVLDILSIDMLGKLNVKKVGAAAERVFEEPATRAFSPTVQIAGQCKPELELLAKELGYSTTSTTEIEVTLRGIRRLAGESLGVRFRSTRFAGCTGEIRRSPSKCSKSGYTSLKCIWGKTWGKLWKRQYPPYFHS
jgi:hypothetical protein